MTDTNSYTVESLSSPYGGHVPWCDARREEGLTERDSIRRYNELYRWYHPDGNSWAGHVRIVGSDEWTYTVEPPAYPGERSSLKRLHHLDDIA
jgi:hypothetical protein